MSSKSIAKLCPWLWEAEMEWNDCCNGWICFFLTSRDTECLAFPFDDRFRSSVSGLKVSRPGTWDRKGQERFNSTGNDILDLNKNAFLAHRGRTMPPVPLGGMGGGGLVSQPTFPLNSCRNELPSVFLSFSIDIPAAASTITRTHQLPWSRVPLQLRENT